MAVSKQQSVNELIASTGYEWLKVGRKLIIEYAIGFVDLKQWQEELARYRLGITPVGTFIRPSVYMDSPLALEMWLRTCLPQFDKAYSPHT